MQKNLFNFGVVGFYLHQFKKFEIGVLKYTKIME